MVPYSIALSLHVAGAVGFFGALGVEWAGQWQMRSATSSEQVHRGIGILKKVRKLAFASMLTTVITGFHMAVTISFGIVFLKIGKPGLEGSLIAVAVAMAVGIASALPIRFSSAGWGRP
jgi:hypothetical protein